MAGSFGKRSGGNEKLRERSGGKLRKIWRDGSIHTGGIESSASHGPLAIRYQPTSFTSTPTMGTRTLNTNSLSLLDRRSADTRILHCLDTNTKEPPCLVIWER